MPNTININKLISKLRSLRSNNPEHEDGFFMHIWHKSRFNALHGHSCGTAACIGGWAFVLSSKSKYSLEDWLGLTEDQCSRLFHMTFAHYSPLTFDSLFSHSARIDVAIEVLEHLRDTGKVEWFTYIDKALRRREEESTSGVREDSSPC